MPEGSEKEVGLARVAFADRFHAFVDYQADEADVLSRERDSIQLFTLTLSRILFLMGENKQGPMLLQYIQTVMGDTVSPKGLNRPIILGQGQGLVADLPEKPEKLMVLKLIQDQEARMAELVLPLGDEGHYYPTSVVFFLQFLIKTLGEPSLFFLMLVLGGVMEYYDKIGKTNDLKALTDAPVYGFSTAVRYIEEERRRVGMNPPPADPASN